MDLRLHPVPCAFVWYEGEPECLSGPGERVQKCWGNPRSRTGLQLGWESRIQQRPHGERLQQDHKLQQRVWERQPKEPDGTYWNFLGTSTTCPEIPRTAAQRGRWVRTQRTARHTALRLLTLSALTRMHKLAAFRNHGGKEGETLGKRKPWESVWQIRVSLLSNRSRSLLIRCN